MFTVATIQHEMLGKTQDHENKKIQIELRMRKANSNVVTNELDKKPGYGLQLFVIRVYFIPYKQFVFGYLNHGLQLSSYLES